MVMFDLALIFNLTKKVFNFIISILLEMRIFIYTFKPGTSSEILIR